MLAALLLYSIENASGTIRPRWVQCGRAVAGAAAGAHTINTILRQLRRIPFLIAIHPIIQIA